MNLSRRLLAVGGLAAIASASRILLAAAQAVASPAADFIAALGNQAFYVIRGTYTLDQKVAYFQALLRQDFDIPATAPFVLGPWWRLATPPERTDFVELLLSFIVVTFGRRLAGYDVAALRVTGVRQTPYGSVVTSQLLRPGAPPVGMDWVLSQSSGGYRVADVVIDGVSMRLSLRSDIAAMMQRTGGTIAGLIFNMRQTIAGGGM